MAEPRSTFCPDRQGLGRSSIAHLRDHRDALNGSNVICAYYVTFILAMAHAELGQFDDAWRCIDEAIDDDGNNQGKDGSRPRSIALLAKSR